MYPHPNQPLYDRIYLAVMQIPAGKVASYGDIATVVGGGVDARTVGYALGDLPEARAKEVPWQRVVNREGAISTRGLTQRQVLEAEGVTFDSRDRVIMSRHQWDGPDSIWAGEQGFHTLPPRDDQGEQLSLF